MTANAVPVDSGNHKKRLILVDGYGFVFRAYHSMPPLTNPEGVPVGAVFGFSNMLSKLLESHQADYIAVILDAGSKTFRNEIYSEYKANRPPAPEDLLPQFPLVRKAVEAFNLPAIEKVGYEADDLIATYACKAKDAGMKVRIVSSDKDLMQLVGNGVELYDPMKSKVISIPQVQEKFGVTPDKVLDVLSLIGDSSDNVPGVPGIGPKIAAELITTFGSLDQVLERAGEVKQNKRRENLINFSDQAKLSRELIKLDCDVAVPLELEDLKVREPDYSLLYHFAQKHNFKSLLSKLSTHLPKEELETLLSDDKNASSEKKTQQNKVTLTQKIITNLTELKGFFADIKEVETIVLHLGIDKKEAVYAIAIAVNGKDSVAIPVVEEQNEQSSLFAEPEEQGSKGIRLEEVASFLEPYLLEPSIKIIGCSIKFIARVLFKEKFSFTAYDDISLMSYVLQAGLHNHSLEDMATAYLQKNDSDVSVKQSKDLSNEELSEKCFNALHLITELYEYLRAALFNDKLFTLYERLEKQLVPVLASMEAKGITLNATYLKGLSDDFSQRMDEEQQTVYRLAGREFNIGSPKQMGEILFDEMGIKGGKKSKKTGAYSTDSEVLENLALEGHEIATHILEWRQLSKLKSTYADALPKQIQADGRVHTHFAMTVTNTGRLSSHNPNLQNIPIRTAEGNKLRQAFTCETGYKLLSADYSQIELRLLAHIAEIDTLKQAFKEGKDIHAATASQVFNVPLEEVTSDLRRKAKTINFGIIYGMSAFGLAKRLGISRSEAAEYIDIYFKQYPGIRTYMETTKEFARKHGYVQTLWQRRCHIKGINDKNGAVRQFSERAAINAPLQGAAADIIKKAMVALYRELEKEPSLKASILLQVHDELVLEAPEDKAEKVASIVKKTMENVVQLSIPLDVAVGVGKHWGEIH